MARISGAAGSGPLAAAASDQFVYVSLPPDSFPVGELAVLHHPRTGETVTASMTNGGLDPVPIAAGPGDTLVLEVRRRSGDLVASLPIKVPLARKPRVVRTWPPYKKRDVVLNAPAVLVFTEPIAGSTLTPSSVQLRRGDSPIAGNVRLLEGSGTIAAFSPAAPLDPNTDYSLVISTAVTDLDGDALLAAVTVPFTTGQSSAGPAATITVSPDTVYLAVAKDYQLTATVQDAAGNILIDEPVAWSVNDPAGLTVSPAGSVTALAPGFYLVTARLNGLAGFARVVVLPGAPASVVVAPQQASVGASGDTIILTATVRDARDLLIRYPSVTWTSSAPGVATVASYDPGDGRVGLATVTGVAQGAATITATSGTARGTASLTVTPALPVASVTVEPASVSLLLRFTRQLTATVNDANGRILLGRSLTWTTDNAGAATVSGSGLVTAVGAGPASVIATSERVSDTAAITAIVLSLRSMTVGESHSCAVATDGAAYCWGWNQFGQLGDSSTIPSFTPVLVPKAVVGGLSFSAVAASYSHTCGLTSGGAAYCWGDNRDGGLAVPVAVSGGLTFSAITAGVGHTCGLTTSGEAYCWGGNGAGELGDGTTTSSAVPVAVTGGLTFSAITAGSGHTCGLTANGDAYCWGSNGYGQLGNGTTRSSLVPLAVTGGHTFAVVRAGWLHTCGLTTNGEAYCWGVNGDGQLGDGSTSSSAVPVAVTGGRTFDALSAGSYHTCGVTPTGAAYCWGWNWLGQLGDGSLTSKHVPVAVTGGLSFSAVPSAGFWHTCGIATTGVAYCWGYNGSAQLGDGTTTSSTAPVRVAGQR